MKPSQSPNLDPAYLVILAIGTLAMRATIGMFNLNWLWILPTFFVLTLFGIPKIKLPPLWQQGLSLGIIALFALTPSFANTFFISLPLYLVHKEYIPWINGLLATMIPISIGIAFFCQQKQRSQAKALLLIAALISTIASCLVIQASPSPIIDAWSVHEEGTQAFVQGSNPYTATYTQIYPPQVAAYLSPVEVSYPYLPGVFLWMAPWKLMGLDTRYSLIFAMILTALLLFKIASFRRQNSFYEYFPALLFLASPLNLHMSEQGWNDPISLFFAAMGVYSLNERKRLAFFIAMNGLLLSKQYNLFIVLIFMMYGYFHFKEKLVPYVLKCAGFFATICGFFLALDWRNFLGSLYGLYHLKQGKVDASFAYRPDAFNLMVWMLRKTGLHSGLVFTCLSLALTALIIWRIYKKRSLPGLTADIATLYLTIFAFAPLAFFNYYFYFLGLVFIKLSLEVAAKDPASGLETEYSTSFRRIDSTLWFFLISRMAILVSWIPTIGTDTLRYFEIARAIRAGGIPYQNFVVEYPPLAMHLFQIPEWLMRLGGEYTISTYRTFYSILLFLFDLGFFLKLLKLEKDKKIERILLWIYLIGGIALADILYDRLDLILGITLFFSVYSMIRQNYFKSALAMIGGTFFKLIPLFFYPIYVLSSWFNRRDLKHFVVSQISLLVLFFIGFALSYLQFGASFLNFLEFHAERPIQVESTWASLWYVLTSIIPDLSSRFTLTHGFGSYNVVTGYSGLETLSNFAIFPVVFALCVWAYFKLQKGQEGLLSLLLVLTSISLGKVLSIQYFVWPLCLLPLSHLAWRSKAEKLSLAGFLMTYLLTGILTWGYFQMLEGDTKYWAVLVMRNVSLVFTTLGVSKVLWERGKRNSSGTI